MINVFFFEVWYYKCSFEVLQDVFMEYKFRIVLEIWEKFLDFCEFEIVVVFFSVFYKGYLFIFNVKVMFCNVCVCFEVDFKGVQEVLWYYELYEVVVVMVNVWDCVKCFSEMIKVI